MLRRLLIAVPLIAAAIGARAQANPIALTGTLITPQDVVEDGTILLQNGRIVASGTNLKLPAGTKVIATRGIIAPGLIDLHNHLTWNIFPRWHPTEEFGNRYDWQQKPVYNVLLTAPHKAIVDQHLECEAERFAEVKAITQGETSVTGSLQDACVHGLDRNLDVSAPITDGAELGPNLPRIVYNVFPFQMTPQAVADAEAALSATPRGWLLIHLAEGAPHNASAAREFEQLKAHGLLLPGVSLIHAVALTPANFAEMAAHGVGFIWSPRSNIELYGDTANVAAARAAGVQIALAPDWSPTGSDGLLSELNYASVWNQSQKPPLFSERDLVLMATATPAALVNLSAQIGSLTPGHAADLIVLTPANSAHDPYWTLTHSTAADLQLVIIGGAGMYGDPTLLHAYTTTPTEPLTICNAPRALVTTGKPFAETESVLDRALRQQGRSLAPLAECSY